MLAAPSGQLILPVNIVFHLLLMAVGLAR